MEKLKELINLINLNKIKSIEIIDSGINSDTKLMQFYNGIRTGKFNDDEEAREYLYPNASDKNAFYKLKHTLRERLFNTLFFIDVKSKKYSNIHKAKLNVQKMNNLVNILLTKGLKKNAIYIAQKALKIATKYEFTTEQLFLLRTLRTHSAIMLGDHSEFKKYDKMVKECAALDSAEIEIESVVFEILTYYVKSRSTKTYVFDIAENYLNNPQRFIPAKPSANWIYHLAMVQIAKYMSINDYEKTLSICDGALLKINALPFVYTKSIINISSQAIVCCIQLRLYEKGEENILMGLKIIPNGIYSWFKQKELHLNLCFHTQRYDKAWLIFNEATLNPKFNSLNTSSKEVWKIYEAWLHFFLNAGKITLNGEAKAMQQFRVSRYANEVATFFKDKRGLNVSILISQMMLLLQQKNYDAIISRMEAIAKYKDRYVDKRENFRSHVFIGMLLTVAKVDFNRKILIEKTREDILQLSTVPLNIANQSSDIEILPYEDVWEILLDQLN